MYPARITWPLLGLLVVASSVACGSGETGSGAAPTADPPDESGDALTTKSPAKKPDASTPGAPGGALFRSATFGGNGRTCTTCHSLATGTVSTSEIEARFAAAPTEPLFRKLDSDNELGLTYNRLRQSGTFKVTVPLPANVTLVDDPAARVVTLFRTAPSTLDTPSLDPVLMWDGREPTLQSQARSAILGHAEATVMPTATQLDDIAKFEKTLFSSAATRSFAGGGAAPQLPLGTTTAEQRGRRFFVEAAWKPPALDGMCAQCHSGPMLNEVSAFNPVPGFAKGARFTSAGASETNESHLPLHGFQFKNPDGTTTTVSSPDPGRALITGNSADVGLFKTSTLWNVKNTAPYFHDGSSVTLEQLAAHYTKFMVARFANKLNQIVVITPLDEADMVAYMKLL